MDTSFMMPKFQWVTPTEVPNTRGIEKNWRLTTNNSLISKTIQESNSFYSMKGE